MNMEEHNRHRQNAEMATVIQEKLALHALRTAHVHLLKYAATTNVSHQNAARILIAEQTLHAQHTHAATQEHAQPPALPKK